MENNNKAHIEYLLNNLSRLTNLHNNKNNFKGVFTIEEAQESAKLRFGIDATALDLNLIYTQLELDGTEYLPTKKSPIHRKMYIIKSEDDINSFYNSFYEEIIQSLALGVHKSGGSYFSHYIKHGLENE